MADPLDNWREEMQGVYLYKLMAQAEKGTSREALFNELAQAAQAQSAIWLKAVEREANPPAFTPSTRVRIAAWLIRRFGPRRVRPILAAIKVRGLSVYSARGHAMPLSLEEVGARHRGKGSGGNLRAAVFGINDGLVSNASLILGVAGATSSNSAILLAGVAGLLAGAFSMAAGEYISVRSQRELFEYQIGLERDELKQYPKEEAAELALIYAARGIPKDEARDLANRLTADPEVALDTLAREELGLNPDDLGSPIGAALSSFFAFATGALIPLAPFLFLPPALSLYVTLALSAASLFGVGATLSLFTGKGALWGGLRMVLLGAAAGGATFGIGKLLGVSLS